jgi:outer membrane receptor for monomeric catechols
VVFTQRPPRTVAGHAADPETAGVTVLTRQVLDDMDATTLRDALRYVTGVTVKIGG